jgi:hypothetical protein
VAGILEDGLWSLRDTGLSEEDKASVVLVISGYLRSEGTLTADLAATSPSPDDVMSGYRQLLATLTDAQRFPAIHAVLAAGVFDTADHPGRSSSSAWSESSTASRRSFASRNRRGGRRCCSGRRRAEFAP